MKKKLGLIFGGPGPENEVSIISSKLIFQNIDHEKYDVFLILMNHEKKFIMIDTKDESVFSMISSSSKYNITNCLNQEIYFIPGGMWLSKEQRFEKIDLVFNDVYGYPGETGQLSGFFDILNINYVGSNLKSSALLMDKEFANIIASYYNVPVLDFEIANEQNVKSFEYYVEKLDGLPFFVKTSNGGSSIGVYKIKSKIDFENSLKEVFKFDKKIVIQKGLELPSEIQLAAFYFEDENGVKKLKISSFVEEIKPSKKYGFYSYEAKYFDASGSEKSIFPLKNLTEKVQNQLYEATEKLFQIFDCSFGGIDFFLDSNGKIYFNELNTLSWFPGLAKRFKACDIDHCMLIDELIENCEKF